MREFETKGRTKLDQTRPKANEKDDDLIDQLFEEQLSPSADGYRNIEKHISPELRELEKSSL